MFEFSSTDLADEKTRECCRLRSEVVELGVPFKWRKLKNTAPKGKVKIAGMNDDLLDGFGEWSLFFAGGWKIFAVKRGSEKVNNKMSFNLIWLAGLRCTVDCSTCTRG